MKKPKKESRSETLDAFVQARKEDPVKQDELSVGELIALMLTAQALADYRAKKL